MAALVYRQANRRAPRVCAIASLLVTVAGCATPARLAAPAATPTETLEAGSAFAEGVKILAGLDLPEDGEPWGVGDQLLFGMRLQDERQSQVSFVRLTLLTDVLPTGTRVTVAPPAAGKINGPGVVVRHPGGLFERTAPLEFQAAEIPVEDWRKPKDGGARGKRASLPVLVAIDIYTAEADIDETVFALVPELILRDGMYGPTTRWVALLRRYGTNIQSVAASQPAEFHEAFQWVTSLGDMVQVLRSTIWQSKKLAPLMNAVLPQPSFLSLMTSLLTKGQLFHVWIHMGHQELLAATTQPAAWPGGAAQRIPLVVRVNDAPLMQCHLQVRPPSAPLELTAGVVAAEAWPENTPSRRLEIRLLASRRGMASSE